MALISRSAYSRLSKKAAQNARANVAFFHASSGVAAQAQQSASVAAAARVPSVLRADKRVGGVNMKVKEGESLRRMKNMFGSEREGEWGEISARGDETS